MSLITELSRRAQRSGAYCRPQSVSGAVAFQQAVLDQLKCNPMRTRFRDRHSPRDIGDPQIALDAADRVEDRHDPGDGAELRARPVRGLFIRHDCPSCSGSIITRNAPPPRRTRVESTSAS